MFEKRQTRRTAKILRDAAEVIETKGWTTGTEQSPTGRVCALGAIKLAAGDKAHIGRGRFYISDKAKRALNEAEAQIKFELPEGWSTILTSFNDVYAHNSTDVTDLFRKAADRVEPKK